jgi:hypothetical protein
VVILHTFLALAAGFAVVALLAIALAAIVARMAPSWTDAAGRPQAGYLFVNLGSSFLAAAAGGYVTAWVAVANPLIQASARQAAHLVPTGAGGHFAHRRAGRRAGQAQSDGNSVGRSTFSICATIIH